jgi:phospholipid transport system substrate-binding protein
MIEAREVPMTFFRKPTGCRDSRIAVRLSLAVACRLVTTALPLNAAEQPVDPPGARAELVADPASFVTSLVMQTLATLQDKQLGDTQREEKFHALLQADFDMPRISGFVLGRHASSASDEEQQNFACLLERRILRLYADRFQGFGGETVTVTGSRGASEIDSIIFTDIIPANGAPPVKLDWRVRHDEGGFKVFDVSVEGVSLALTERDAFAFNQALEDERGDRAVTAHQGN